MATHEHPIFTRVYGLISRMEEGGSVGRARSQAAEGLSGRVLIVGLGPGLDLEHMPEAVREVAALEPSSSMRASAAGRIAEARERGIEVELIDGVAENVPLPDASVDGVLFAYVLCTIQDPDLAVQEAVRVLKPGGHVAVMEHVRAADGTFTRLVQRGLSRIWPLMGGGCHCDRDTRAVLERAGLDTRGVEDVNLVGIPPVNSTILGDAFPR
ncbi:MAG: class I SAM-dependent methyltransferase [Candidatus Nanopelagicales bacterium]|nr:class I SAM-dependent methyltransferase [Candidatus Nanopelagicales bacterium]